MFAPAEGLAALVVPALLLGWAPDTNPRQASTLASSAAEVAPGDVAPADVAAADVAAADVASEAPADTILIEVGSPEVDGSVYPPHRARNRVYIGDSPEVVSTWVNELTVGDSAGIPVMRWVSRSEALEPGAGTWQLLQTYHARTLEPLGYWLTTSSGVETKLVMDGKRIRGTKRQSAGAAVEQVDMTVERRGFFAGASDLVPLAVGLEEGAVMIAPFWHPSMQAPESRVFTVVREEAVEVEGESVLAWRVEEREQATGDLLATWWLTDRSPFMVLAEMTLDDGRIQRITGVDLGDH